MKRWTIRALLLAALLLLCLTPAAAARAHGSVQNQRFDGYTIRQGVDVSEHNGPIDWRAVAASGQADFAFIRVGYRGYSSGGLYPDSRCRENLAGALDAGLEVGVYFYSQAITQAEAREEAEYALELLGSYASRITLPVVIDFEYAESDGYVGRLYDAKLTQSAATGICNAFCSVVAAAGFEPCVYANSVVLTDKLDAAALKGTVWMANYVDESGYAGDYTYWQYTSSGGVAGFAGLVDRNYWYVAPPDRFAVRAQSIELREQSMSLSAGQSRQLVAEIHPSDSVDTLRFYSEDPTIAFVDKLSGEITGFRAGMTRVWAETANGVIAFCDVEIEGSLEIGRDQLSIVSAPSTIFTGPDTRTDLVVCAGSVEGVAARVNTDLNLRAWPSTELAPLTLLKEGEIVTVLAAANWEEIDWLAVDVAGQRGYVAAAFLTVDVEAFRELTEGVDYIAVYSDNDGPGQATVTVEGIGRFTGSDSASFRIFSFADVRPGDWYYDAVLNAVRKGTMNGTSDTAFSPNTATSRAMMATVIHRMDGSPRVEPVAFDDVEPDRWYAQAAWWACLSGVDTGVGENTFAPNAELSRAVMVTMLYNYTRYLGCETPVDLTLGESFSDWEDTPEEARDAVCWALSVGLIQGMGNGILSPGTGATRAQMCTILGRYELLLEQLTPVLSGGMDPGLAGD